MRDSFLKCFYKIEKNVFPCLIFSVMFLYHYRLSLGEDSERLGKDG